MPQLFARRSNTIVRVLLLGGALTAAGGAWAGFRLYWSPWQTQVGEPVPQPVPFSHQHHVGGLGIDCRYCHTSVETARSAGMPATETCMTCHSQVWRDAPVLEPVRASWREQRPLAWTRVNDLPDYTYFDHHVHISKGVGCASCHGDVASMPLTSKAQPLAMRWCLECHRHPETALRPRADVYNTSLVREQPHPELLQARHIDTERLSDCSTCHR